MNWQWELDFLHWVVDNLHPSAALDWVMKIFTVLGDMAIIWFLLAFIMLLFKDYRKTGIVMLVGLIVVAGFNLYILKPIIDRPRPFLDDPYLATYVNGFFDTEGIFKVPDGASFMSGHALSSFIAAATIAHYHKKLAIPAYLFGAIVAFTRLYFAVHYPTDTIAGTITGVLFAYILIYFADKIEKKLIKRKEQKRHAA